MVHPVMGGDPRRLTMSRTGRWVLVRDRDHRIELVDLVGTMPNRRVDIPSDAVAEFVGRELWALHDQQLVRLSPTDLTPLSPLLRIPAAAARILPTGGAAIAEAVLLGEPHLRVLQRNGAVVFEVLDEVAPDEVVVAGVGVRIYVATADTVRALERGREVWKLSKHGAVVDVINLFGGRVIAAWFRRPSDDLIVIVQAHGQLIHRIAVPPIERWAVAEELGQAWAQIRDGAIHRIDLRYGRTIATGLPVVELRELAVDQNGGHAVVVNADEEVLHFAAAALLQPPANAEDGAVRDEAADADPDAPAPKTEVSADDDDAQRRDDPGSNRAHAASGAALGAPIPPVPPPPPADARAAAPLPPNLRPRPRVEIPDALPLAFGPPTDGMAATVAAPYATARAHLDLLLDMVAARATVAIADAWNSGRLSQTNATPRPSELEVLALAGRSGGFAGDQLLEARGRFALRQRAAGELVAEAAAAGAHLPFPALIRELGLSPLAAQILLVAAAPLLRGEIARLYGVLSNDPARPLVDRFLVEQLIAGGNSARRDDIGRELANDAALVRNGLVQIDAAPIPLFARLVVPETLLDRLRCIGPVRSDDIAQIRRAETPLDRLLIPPEVKRKLALALAEPAPPHAQIRVVVRGRRGTGRHSLIAAVAARVGRDIVAIDTTRMPRGRRELIVLLRAALFRASLHGLVPVLSGLETIEHTDVDVSHAVRQVLRNHPGPICVATSPEATLPIDPGFVEIELPPLLELERAGAWARLAGDAGLTADVNQLAARYRIGPGIISKVIHDLSAAASSKGDATAALDNQVRQYVAARLNHVAKRVERIAHWEDLALPEELLDSLREFISRARHRRTVYEEWGYDAKMTTSRGLTALFYGPPGTGKTMVAGVIAQELGLDMYRVDLARVVSKWVGETEKNLAEVFDAAEDGQVLILFDEADSLFAKRTDVRTSNDRYANLEVNYLLQRLDTFEGIAILTSNLDSAIDPAFRRRLSLRLQFPFPDEETRLRLWTSHVTAETPVAGDFDFIELARRYPLSGGYIRNCALRAAFLAAHEQRPLAQSHLVRAIQLEYREIGKLSTTSRLE